MATGCGPYLSSGSGFSYVGAGLPAGVVPGTLASSSSGIFGGTVRNGLWRFSGASWTAEPVLGYVGTGTVNVVRSFGGALWVAMAEGLFSRPSGGPFSDVSAGIPSAVLVASLGGDGSTAFAGLATGGVYRREAGGEFRRDAVGLNAAPVLSLDLSGGRLWAAAGPGGRYLYVIENSNDKIVPVMVAPNALVALPPSDAISGDSINTLAADPVVGAYVYASVVNGDKIDIFDMKEGVPMYTGHMAIDLSNHQRCLSNGSLNNINANTEAHVPVFVGR